MWTRGRHAHKRFHTTRGWIVRRNPLDLRYVEYGWTTRECMHWTHERSRL